MQRSAPEWESILVACGVSRKTATNWGQIFSSHIGPETFSLNDEELPDFLGQVLHESGMLERLEESLNYKTAARICAIWPSRFKSSEAAAPFVSNPEALANKVYGGRLGNSVAGDGWRYRGRGLLQVTGRTNYQALGEALGIQLVRNPDLLATPDIALRACIAWWEDNVPDAFIGDTGRVTKAVNGGKHGIADRDRLTLLADAALRGAS